MKKVIAIALFVSAAIGFTACSSNDDGPIKVKADYTGTWETDKLSYTIGDKVSTHDYVDMPGENAVSQNDELVLTENTAVLTEYFQKSEKPTVTKGIVKDDVIMFDNSDYKPRKINGVVNGKLSLTYEYTMRGATLDVIVTYTKK